MTCRNQISSMFCDKSRSDLLDYVCDRIDSNEKDIQEMWDCIGKVLAYLETKDFSECFESVNNEKYIREKIKKMLKTTKWYCVEFYRENWANRLKEEKNDRR